VSRVCGFTRDCISRLAAISIRPSYLSLTLFCATPQASGLRRQLDRFMDYVTTMLSERVVIPSQLTSALDLYAAGVTLTYISSLL